MMRDIIASPTANNNLPEELNEDLDEENLIKVKLFFYCAEKSVH